MEEESAFMQEKIIKDNISIHFTFSYIPNSCQAHQRAAQCVMREVRRMCVCLCDR